MMSAPSSKLQDGARQTADGGTVERADLVRNGQGLVWTALHSSNNNKHGPPGSCKLLLPSRVSPGALEVPGSLLGCQRPSSSQNGFAIARLLSINAPSDRETSFTAWPTRLLKLWPTMTINQSIR